jgi:hypothetical protein
MKTIDQRILIPAAPEIIWAYISDVSNNSRWQVDQRSISFLASKRSGPGIRWRYTTAKNQEYVVEITAWYDGLGYEYTFIDGAPYKSCSGRFRLQEIPEGTIVQWTFTYEYGGIFGFLRNIVDNGSRIEDNMAMSLRALWKQLNPKGSERDLSESKALMRDGLSYEARAQYKPRHPSAKKAQKERPPMVSPLREPPIADDDTRPNLPVTATAATSAPAPELDLFDLPEIEFEESPFAPSASSLDDLFAPPATSTDSERFAPPRTSTPALESEPEFLKDVYTPSEPMTPVEFYRQPLDLPEIEDIEPARSSEVNAEAVPAFSESDFDFDFSDLSISDNLPPEIDAPINDEMVALFGPPAVPPPLETTAVEPPPTPKVETNPDEPAVDQPQPKKATQPVLRFNFPEVDLPAEPSAPEVQQENIETPPPKTATQPMLRFDFPEIDFPAEPTAETTMSPAETTPAQEDLYTEVTRPTSTIQEKSLDEVSIWDVFGVPRPSETQEHRAVRIEPETSSPPQETETEAEITKTTRIDDYNAPTQAIQITRDEPEVIAPELLMAQETSAEPTDEQQPTVIEVQPLHQQPVGFRIVMRRRRTKLRRR